MFTLYEKIRERISSLTNRLATVTAALMRPFRRARRAFLWLIFEGTDNFQELMSSLARGIAWPFWAVGQRLLNLLRWLSTPWSRLANSNRIDGLRGLLHRIGVGLLSVTEAFNLDRPLRGLIWLLQPVWRPAVAMVGFGFAWASTRNYRQLLWGLPALLVLFLPLLFVLAQAIAFGSGSITESYRLAVKQAMESKEYAQVQFYERKLAQLGVDTKLTDFRTAETFAEDGKLDEAYARMQLLAPTDEPGFPAAHYWILSQLFRGELQVDADESIRLAEIHLQHLGSLGIDDPGLQRMRIHWLLQSNQLAEAVAELEPLAILDWDFASQRMQVNLSLRKMAEAREDARLVLQHIHERKRTQRRLTSKEYESWAVAASLLNDEVSLKSILLEWQEHEPDNVQPRKNLAQINRLQFEKLLHAPQASARVLGDMLIEAQQVESDSTMIDNLVQDIVTNRVPTPVFRRLAEYLLQAPGTPVRIYEQLGSAAASTNELELARLLLERALEADQDRMIVWNNYAWVLANGAVPDLEHALDAANRALEIASRSPAEFRVRETRGQILASLERWPEAIADLRYAINGMPGNKKIHLSLAKAYAAQEDSDLAQMHQSLAE